MNFPYFPHSEENIRQMLDACSLRSLEDLYGDVPSDFIYRREYELPDAMSEMEVRRFFEELASKNRILKVFCGQGAYDHYSPAVIPAILSRSEFLTAYTPYQAEISQGTLRYIFEYQSMICELTGMDATNASMYDGATAAAEAVLMAYSAVKKKNRILVSDTLLPHIADVVKTYALYHGVQLTIIPSVDGETSLKAIKSELVQDDVAGVLVPSVNRFGIIENLDGFADAIHSAKALFIIYSDPSTLAVLKTPREWGADICCGDCQSLGLPLNFGGPYVGYLACIQEFVRKLPGRIAGQTVDADGKRAFVLTLQAREQHIRREKATSNICSNQSLMALYVTIYLSLMGPEGLAKVNSFSCNGAHYLYDKLLATGLFKTVYDKPFLKEFVLKPLVPAGMLKKTLMKEGFFGAVSDKDGNVSFCVTEQRTKEEIDALVDVVRRIEK